MQKECIACHSLKPLEQFYKHKQMADGHVNRCIKCHNQLNRDNYRKKKDYYQQYELERNKTEERKSQKLRYLRKTRKLDKGKARVAVNNAVRHGHLIKTPCKVCGNVKVEGHHPDYRSYLKVEWLCFKHHRELHSLVL